jgi:hypothetical protein
MLAGQALQGAGVRPKVVLVTPYVLLLSQLTALHVLSRVMYISPWPGWMSAAASRGEAAAVGMSTDVSSVRAAHELSSSGNHLASTILRHLISAVQTSTQWAGQLITA